MTRIAITGVTGHLGGFVASALSDAGIPARHLARSPERAPKLAKAEVKNAVMNTHLKHLRPFLALRFCSWFRIKRHQTACKSIWML